MCCPTRLDWVLSRAAKLTPAPQYIYVWKCCFVLCQNAVQSM